MDNFAVSLAIGTAQSVRTIKPMARLARVFGVSSLHAIAGLARWIPGRFSFRGRESGVLCGVLAVVGWRMLRSATQESDQGQLISPPAFGATVSLGFVTSIDCER